MNKNEFNKSGKNMNNSVHTYDQNSNDELDDMNSLFSSDSPAEIIEFYDKFNTKEELISWMINRPKGNALIYEVDGPKDIIVVIPTIDHNGTYAKICKEEIYEGFHIIFVESGRNNPYFNYAHNCNVGISKALEYGPKWIIISNDDMQKKDSPETLRSEVNKYNHGIYDILFAETSRNHTLNIHMGRLNNIGILLLYLASLVPNSIIKRGTNNKLLKTASRFKKFLFRYKISKKFGVKPYFFTTSEHWRLYMDQNYRYILFQDFGVFSSRYITNKRGGILFDDTFINAHEDQMISIELSMTEYKHGQLRYSVDSKGGASFGDTLERALRTSASDIYLSVKLEAGHLSN